MGESWEEALPRLFLCKRVIATNKADGERQDEVAIEEFVNSFNWHGTRTVYDTFDYHIYDAFYHKVEVDPLMAEEAFRNAFTDAGVVSTDDMIGEMKSSLEDRTGQFIESDDFLEVATALSLSYDADSNGVVTGDEFWAGM